MRVRPSIAALVGVVAMVLLSGPVAVTAQAAPTGVPSATRWYEGKTGTVQWAFGAEFQNQLEQAGASLSFCSAAKVATDAASGVTYVTMPVSGNSVIQLNGRENSVDAVADCTVTITGNGTSVQLDAMSFGVASASTSDISATVLDEYTVLGTGARMKLPRAATRNKITVVSPVVVMSTQFADILRGQQNAATGEYDGPVPTMTTEPTSLGLFRLALKVKSIREPSVHNSEG